MSQYARDDCWDLFRSDDRIVRYWLRGFYGRRLFDDLSLSFLLLLLLLLPVLRRRFSTDPGRRIQ
jgi:hypothetical protein